MYSIHSNLHLIRVGRDKQEKSQKKCSSQYDHYTMLVLDGEADKF
ncbi:hypothetical protein VMF7928_00159 [Vibrio marisflavi CECT 7928]|uniref:Uncharacterized protein n=1 Tax=Vibrio marisflavi CECT 7928 TaxID=634439 RepID=A0ABN8DWZ2_9VIBR|nr:hypothetical protein VMF7928_00159 [Vibrio marisflavi CECT 7928]